MALSLFEILQRRLVNPSLSPQGKVHNANATHVRFQKFPAVVHRLEELSNKSLIFHVEGALLKSSSLFPYFVLVAFEAGGPLRALILCLLYPFVWLLGEELGLKIMVFVCFVGIKRKSFRIGRTVLPKFFLDDVGYEGFNVVISCRRKVGLSDLPRVMVEGFLRDYVGVDGVVGRELKVVGGYFVGLMEKRKDSSVILNEIFGQEEKMNSHIIGLGCLNKSLDQQLFSHCNEIYLVSEVEKRNWRILARDKYPKPLIFHDGRLAFRPTPLATIVMFLWLPLGFFLFIVRFTAGILLPYSLSSPILAFTGLRATISRPDSSITSTIGKDQNSRGVLYVCNHRTLLDPIYISIALSKPLTSVVFGISKVTEVLSPIKNVRLTRDRERDAKLMKMLLSQDDIVICPEGTTCREPYLLRFSPLFAELTDEIVPVAIDVKVSMFYGTTATGFKCLDPLFFLLNPSPAYHVKFLSKLPGSYTCRGGGKSRFEVANHVQGEIANALGFQCTSFTRKDKYMSLAGNDNNVGN